jgi:PadR family transcriptional regulator, regulatory protein PadR
MPGSDIGPWTSMPSDRLFDAADGPKTGNLAIYLDIGSIAVVDKLSRVTPATVDVLQALLSSRAPVWGLSIVKQVGRPPGSVYPILARIEAAGWAVSVWDDDAKRGPRRRLYSLTASGATLARETCSSFASKRATASPRYGRTANWSAA